MDDKYTQPYIYYAAKRHAQLQFNTISIRVLRSSVKWEKTTVYHRSSFDVIPKSADSFKCSQAQAGHGHANIPYAGVRIVYTSSGLAAPTQGRL